MVSCSDPATIRETIGAPGGLEGVGVGVSVGVAVGVSVPVGVGVGGLVGVARTSSDHELLSVRLTEWMRKMYSSPLSRFITV